MQIDAASVEEYLARIPASHRPAVAEVREVMRRHLPSGFEEGVLYGMIAWYIPPERHGHSYNGQPLTIAALASQKNYMALYLTGVTGDPAVHRWFTSAFAAAGKKLDMGKSCVRFRSLDDLALDVIGQVAARISVDDFLAAYLQTQEGRKQKPIVLASRPAAKKAAASKAKAAAAQSEQSPSKAKSSSAKPRASAAKAKPPSTKSKPSSVKPKASSAKAKPSSRKSKPSAKATARPAKAKSKAAARTSR